MVLSLSSAKQHLRLMHTNDDDEYVTDLIWAAQEWLTSRTERTFTPTRYTATLCEFPADNKIWLAYPPVVEAEITYYNGAGSQVSYTDFTLLARSNEAYLECGSSGWPVPAIRPDAVTVDYRAGYDTESVPYAARHAVRLLIGTWFANRESTISTSRLNHVKVEHALDALVGVLKTGRTGGGYAYR